MTLWAHDLVGHIFGGYQIDVLIEHNGVTGIFVGQKEGRDRIIKIALVQEAKALILHEESVLNKLVHPKIVQLIERIDVDGMPALVLFRHSRGALTKYKGRLSRSDMESIFTGLLEVCSFLESKGVVHRDIKLENVVLDDSGSPILIDFGTSHMIGEGKEFFVGSSEYAAPEVQRDPKEGTALSDLYSVGVLVYVLLYEKFPAVEDSLNWVDISFSNSELSLLHQKRLTRLLQPNRKYRTMDDGSVSKAEVKPVSIELQRKKTIQLLLTFSIFCAVFILLVWSFSS